MITWSLIVLIGIGSYGMRLAGLTLFMGRGLPSLVTGLLRNIPAALIAALIVAQTVSSGGSFALDARLFGVAMSIVAVAFRAPFMVVFAVGVTGTALIRLLGG